MEMRPPLQDSTLDPANGLEGSARLHITSLTYGGIPQPSKSSSHKQICMANNYALLLMTKGTKVSLLDAMAILGDTIQTSLNSGLSSGLFYSWDWSHVHPFDTTGTRTFFGSMAWYRMSCVKTALNPFLVVCTTLTTQYSAKPKMPLSMTRSARFGGLLIILWSDHRNCSIVRSTWHVMKSWLRTRATFLQLDSTSRPNPQSMESNVGQLFESQQIHL